MNEWINEWINDYKFVYILIIIMFELLSCFVGFLEIDEIVNVRK